LSATLESQVRAYIEENELKNKVEFLGYLEGEKKDQVFADSDVLVLPTYGEGMPVVILEALSWGLPALTTPVGAISEVLSDGLDSILFDPGDVHFLADAIAKLEADRKLVVRLSQRALTKADSYTPSMFRQRLSSLFREIYKNVLLKNL
jgi:glycosyltransferase involved in cell wall biosynthesis